MSFIINFTEIVRIKGGTGHSNGHGSYEVLGDKSGKDVLSLFLHCCNSSLPDCWLWVCEFENLA